MRGNGWLKTLVIASMALGFAACESDDGPLAPVANDGPTVMINGVELLQRPAGGLTLAESATVAIDEQGGGIKLSDARFWVPAKALGAPTKITMSHDDSAYSLWAYDFGPSGLKFYRSATLTIYVTAMELKVMGIDPSRLRVAHASTSISKDWSIVGGVWDEKTQTISVPVDHFSRYALCLE